MRNSTNKPAKVCENSHPGTLVPHPPTQPNKPTFIRRKEPPQCHTPDQGGGGPKPAPRPFQYSPVVPFEKPCQSPPQRRRYILQNLQSPFSKVENTDSSRLEQSPKEGEESICFPYEIENKPKTIRARKMYTKKALLNSVKKFEKPVDLRKGSFSSKQIMSANNSLNVSRNEECVRPLCVSNLGEFNFEDDLNQSILNPSSRTPSPLISTNRNSKIAMLSKRFKINKATFLQSMEKESLRNSSRLMPSKEFSKENRTYTPQPPQDQPRFPWQNFVQDLDFITKIQDTNFSNPVNGRRNPVRLVQL